MEEDEKFKTNKVNSEIPITADANEKPILNDIQTSNSNQVKGTSSVPKLTSLAASNIPSHKLAKLGPILPHVQATLTHDHNAFLCSLFNKIDLDKEKEILGPFSMACNSKIAQSIIAEAVEQHKPVGQEDLPDYNDTISSMVINAHKKVFKSEYETASESHAEQVNSSTANNLNLLCSVDSIRRAVYSGLPSKPSLQSARNSTAPYPTHHGPYRQNSQDADKRVSPHHSRNHDNSSLTGENTRVLDGNSSASTASSTQMSDPSSAPSSSTNDDLPPPPRPVRSPRTSDSGEIGPVRIRRKRNSSSVDEDENLSRNEQRLFDAVCTNNVGRAELLLSSAACGATITDSRGRTPLHIAAAHGYTHLARLLLKYSADPNRLDSIGNRPLDLALSGRQTDVAADLILAGTDATADKDAAVAALTKLARQMLTELRAVDNVANVHTSKLYQTVTVLQHAMTSYQFSCPEVTELLQELSQRGLADTRPEPSAVDELSAALSKRLYFDT